MTKFFLWVGGLLSFSLHVSAANLFESNEVLMVTLNGPLNTLIRKKKDEQQYPFVLRADGLDHRVMVSARGNSRLRVCVFPPLRLEFGADIPEQSVFFGQDNLKLVSHCHKSEKAQASALKEYAAYQFFTLLSDAAYRVRLLQIVYKDTDGKQDAMRYGFLIEPTNAMVKRIGGDRTRQPAVSQKNLDDQQEALVYVFQYLIGNTDWSMVSATGDDECCHNGKLIKREQHILYVPYDFDLSGLVNASYAYPEASLRINKVTQRLYRGFCMDQEVLRHAIQTIRFHQADFRTIVDNLPVLNEGKRKKIHRFLDRFFEEANDEEKMLRSFEKRCLD
jgi:hypothetical protein